MPRHYSLPEFWDAYQRLPAEIRDLADRSYALLRAAPEHPSLLFKKVGKVYSVRVGLHYRALATPRGEDFLWFWIGPHSEYGRLLRSLAS